MEPALLVSVIAWFVSSFITGLCGLGAAIIAMPAMLVVLPVQKVALVSCLTALGLTCAMAVWYRRHCPWKSVLWMTLGAVPGGLVGLYVLQNFPGPVLEIVVGAMIVFCIVGMQYLQGSLRLENSPRNCLVAGILAGIIGTSITIDGPVVALFALFIGLNLKDYLGFTSCFFFLRNVVSDIMQAASGLYTPEIVHIAMWCLPASLLGFALSIPLVSRISVEIFRKVVKGIIVLAGVFCLGRGIWGTLQL